DTGARVVALPHALNDRIFRLDKPDSLRPIDIGERSARYPAFIGDDERNQVHDLFSRIGPKFGLRVDIDTGSRLDRDGWARFLNDCRGTIGTEAGSWYLEKDDRTALEIRECLSARPGRREPGREHNARPRARRTATGRGGQLSSDQRTAYLSSWDRRNPSDARRTLAAPGPPSPDRGAYSCPS